MQVFSSRDVSVTWFARKTHSFEVAIRKNEERGRRSTSSRTWRYVPLALVQFFQNIEVSILGNEIFECIQDK